MIFVRHAVTEAGPDVCYGRLDVALGPGAEAEMSACVAALPPISAIVTSPLTRCRALADRVAERAGLTARVDPRWREYDFGAWEGRRWAEISRAESEPWTADILNAAPPGGERFTDLIGRVRAALGDVPEGALVVTHAGPIRAARMILTGAGFDTVFAELVPHCQPLHLGREAA